MKAFKKLTAFLLTFVMLLGLMPILDLTSIDFPTASLKSEAAADDVITSGDYQIKVLDEAKKTCSITGYTGTDTDLVLPSVFNGYTVTEIGNGAFKGKTFLSSVTIPDSVITIGDWAFAMTNNNGYYIANSLKTVNIGNSVKTIGVGAFKCCVGLTSITIPDSVITIGAEAFGMFEYWDWFSISNELKNVTIGETVETIGNPVFSTACSYIFDYYYISNSLKTIIIGNSVESIGDLAFSGCNITSITIPDSVKTIGEGAFGSCSNLLDITIGNSVEAIGNWAFSETAYYNNEENWENGIFYIGQYLLDVKDPLQITYEIKNGTRLFSNDSFINCPNLEKIRIPTSVKYINDSAFKESTNLTIYGVKGFYAETFAKAHNIPFVATDPTIAFDLEKGTGGPQTTEVPYNTVFTVPEAIPQREEGTFLGWTDAKGSKEVKYKSGDSFTVTEDRILYALWDLKEYTVMYNGNGGTGIPESQIKEHGNDLILRDSLPVREGYTFLGWAKDKNAETPEYLPGSHFSLNNNAILYAVWKINRYTLSFDLNGGNGSVGSITADYGTEVNLPKNTPEKHGLPFLGWAKDKNAETAEYQPSDKIVLTNDLTLYAVWKIEKRTLSYDLNGGNGLFEPIISEYGTTIQISSDKPTKNEGRFLGWTTGKGSKTVVYQPSDKLTLTEDTTLYAVWEMNTYFITYDPNGGDVTPDIELFEYGTPTPLTITRTSKEGLYFIGWSEDKDATEPTYLPGGLYTAKGTATLYAVFGEKPLFKDGDVDGDGKVTLNDAMLILGEVAKVKKISAEFKFRADIDEDGKTTLNDAMYILSYVAKKSDTVKPKK